jgi:hypothetical protein
MSTRVLVPHALGLFGVLALLGCPRSTLQDNTTPGPDSSPPSAAREDPAEHDAEVDPAETAHRVVFADRTSQGYLLLVDDRHAATPTREEIGSLVRKNLGDPEADPEVKLLLELVDTEPLLHDPKLLGQPSDGSPRETTDLLGLHIEVLPLRSAAGELVSVEQLTDPILTRDLDDAARASLAKRNKAILLRVDYRNRYGVRGLRMLQTLVRLVATDRDALVFDPDTNETLRLATFVQRRLQSSLGNVSDQIAVVPFPDGRHGERFVRLSTRGMRRFGSVDIELDGLPRDPQVLQAATHLLHGLAYRLVHLGEFDPSGYAVELPQVVTVERDDVVQAYARNEDRVPRCSDCPGVVEVHLVERAAEPHDPAQHVVARVVAPRAHSDADDYDHPKWASSAVSELFGPL